MGRRYFSVTPVISELQPIPVVEPVVPLPDGEGTWLQRSEWHACMDTHQKRVGKQADAFVGRRSRGEKHPVEDFLFTYYSFPPGKLKQWAPALGVTLEILPEDAVLFPWATRYAAGHSNHHLELNPAALPPHLRELAGWIAALCENILRRPPRFRCYGLHEWAMVYRQTREAIRHQGYELRLSPEQLAGFVESQALCCSHYDAFRFFTPESRPMNAFQPVLETRLEMEQGACLHANMDLYKWAAKLWPWVGSDLVADCFLLAAEGRDLDMRASPYDLEPMGYAPIKIETAAGREEYEQMQRELAAKAIPARERLRQAALTLSRLEIKP